MTCEAESGTTWASRPPEIEHPLAQVTAGIIATVSTNGAFWMLVEMLRGWA